MLHHDRFIGSAGLLAAACILALISFFPRCSAQAPLLSQISPTVGVPGTLVAITGEHFGPRQVIKQVTKQGTKQSTIVHKSSITFGGIVTDDIKLWSDTVIVVAVPATTVPGPEDVVLTIYNVKEEHPGKFTVLVANNLTPSQGPVGTVVTIPGTGFGATQGTSKVLFGATETTTVRLWSDSQVIVEAPDPGAAATSPMDVTVKVSNVTKPEGKFSIVPVTQAYLGAVNPNTTSNSNPQQQLANNPVPPTPPHAPTIAAINPTSGAASTPVIITGNGFGQKQGTVSFGKVNAPNITKWGDTEIDVNAPDLSVGASPGNVVVTLNGGSPKSNAMPFTETPAIKPANTPAPSATGPSISAITPIKGVAGTQVTITGTGFGDTQGKSLVTIGGQPVTVTKDNWTNIKIVATAPDLSQLDDFDSTYGFDATVSVSIAGTDKSTPPVIASGNFTELPPQWGDDDEIPVSVKMVGGYEQGFQSSQSANSDAFIAVYGHRLFKDRFGPFYSLRLQTAPQASGTNSVVSVFSNPSGGVTMQSLQTVGAAVDLSLGMEFQFARLNKGQTTLGVIGGGGFVTPLQLNSISTAFTMPAFGTVECTALQSRLSGVLNNPIYAGIKPNTASTSTSCFSNITTSTPAALSLLEYAAPDQPNFFPKYAFGLRFINRWPGTSANFKQCSSDNQCERGYVDFTLGQNASLTGGSLQHMILNIDSIYPITLSKPSFLYLFGSISRRFGALPPYVPPLVLATGTISTTPAASTLILPLTQPDRDFYRIGAGINLNEIFSALKPKSSTDK
jgi:hypothetical protein